ncbi:unnamed protein product [Pleuronectes platessa]|uniref:Uncharacterized protein n=1 Tax=Pleuronectes platessa TaxID=8262 RepID=A0A9N7VP59_PLEPL|nr:unnamed protein product [Pleuronectes platessa]
MPPDRKNRFPPTDQPVMQHFMHLSPFCPPLSRQEVCRLFVDSPSAPVTCVDVRPGKVVRSLLEDDSAQPEEMELPSFLSIIISMEESTIGTSRGEGGEYKDDGRSHNLVKPEIVSVNHDKGGKNISVTWRLQQPDLLCHHREKPSGSFWTRSYLDLRQMAGFPRDPLTHDCRILLIRGTVVKLEHSCNLIQPRSLGSSAEPSHDAGRQSTASDSVCESMFYKLIPCTAVCPLTNFCTNPLVSSDALIGEPACFGLKSSFFSEDGRMNSGGSACDASQCQRGPKLLLAELLSELVRTKPSMRLR